MRITLIALGVVVALGTGCAEDAIGPSPDLVVLDPRSSAPGIVFGSFDLETSDLDRVHTGWMQGGALDPSTILSKLSATRSKGGRAVIKLSKGKDSYVKNADGTFSLSKWKSLVSRYRNVNLDPYISDGTILGHYLIDEPHRASRWGGKAISPSTLEEMARYSKQLWPNMTTMVRVSPGYLAGASTTYRYLDAAWSQYAYVKGATVGTWIGSEVATAKRAGLGLVVGLNVLNGGDGSSRIAGTTSGKYAMSASEVRSYGTTLLNQSYACGFFNWMFDSRYYGRTDIRNAMADVSALARSHAKTSCRQ
jgi:hypothetical protein